MKSESRGLADEALTRRLFFSLPIVLFLAALVSANFLPSTTSQVDRSLRTKERQAFYTSLRDNLSNSVIFASPGDPQVNTYASVESISKFVHERSGLELSEKVKEKLGSLEYRALSREISLIGIEKLCDVLTETAMERLSYASDTEIDQAATILSRGSGYLIMRANGAGYFQTSELISHAKVARELIRQNSDSIRSTIKSEIMAELNNRIIVYSEALPSQFGEAHINGLTPVQASLLIYSIVTDDSMADSQLNVKGQVQDQAGNLRAYLYAYGVDGYVFATPVDLILDEATITKVLDRMY